MIVLAITNGAYAAAVNGAVVGVVVSVLCQAKVKESALMVFIGASTSLIPVFLVRKIGLPKVESPKGLIRNTEVNRVRMVGFVYHLFDTAVFVFAARKLGVLDTNGSILYVIVGTLCAAKCFLFIDSVEFSGPDAE